MFWSSKEKKVFKKINTLVGKHCLVEKGKQEGQRANGEHSKGEEEEMKLKSGESQSLARPCQPKFTRSTTFSLCLLFLFYLLFIYF